MAPVLESAGESTGHEWCGLPESRAISCSTAKSSGVDIGRVKVGREAGSVGLAQVVSLPSSPRLSDLPQRSPGALPTPTFVSPATAPVATMEEDAYASGSGLPGAQYYTVTRVENPSSKNPNIISLNESFPSDGTVDRWPAEHEEMRLMNRMETKSVFWRASAGEWFARGVGLWNGTFCRSPVGGKGGGADPSVQTRPRTSTGRSTTCPKATDSLSRSLTPRRSSTRLQRPTRSYGPTASYGVRAFLLSSPFALQLTSPPSPGHKGRKIRSAISLGRHIAHLANPVYPSCPCDGCKTSSGGASAPARATSRSVRSDSPAFNPKPRLSRGAGKPGVKAQAKAKAKPRAKKNKSRSPTPESAEDGRYYKSTPPTTDSEDSDRPEGGHWGYKFPSRRLRTELPAKELPKRVPQPGRQLLTGEDELDQMKVAFAEEDEEMEWQRKEDIGLSALPRKGELVWVKIEFEGQASSIERWPGIIRARTLEWTGEDVTEVKFEVALLAAQDVVETDDVVPWLGFIPHDLTSAMGEEGRTFEPGQQTLEQLVNTGFPSVVAAFVHGHHIGRWYSTIQARSFVLAPLRLVRS